MTLHFPNFDPVAIRIGPLAIRWYALAYIAGLMAGWQLMRRLAVKSPFVTTPELVDDFLSYATMGVILGGRLGYICFYRPSDYFSHPLEIFKVWQGGMSFHGGFLGVCVATLIFTRLHKIDLWAFADRLAVVAPIGLCLGRIANFINGELWGRVAPPGTPFAMTFPNAPDQLPRYPSQLIQASLEGALLFVILFTCSRSQKIRTQRGLLTGLFLVGYGVFRSIGEIFREPDDFLGFLWEGATLGPLLSAPMIVGGLVLIGWGLLQNRKQPAA